MRFKFVKCLIFIIIFLSFIRQAVSRELTPEEYVQRIFSATQQAWPGLQQVWNTPLYNQLRLVVADDHNAWALDSHSLTRIPYTEIQNRHLTVEYLSYKQIQWSDARPTLFVGLGPTRPDPQAPQWQSETSRVPTLFSLATHEAFHFYVQTKKGVIPEPDKLTRSTPYPVQDTPRFYRNNLIRALYATLRGEHKGLGEARYWYNLWTTVCPDDASRIRQTDLVEGTARYIEIAAEIMAQGHPFNSITFRHALIEQLMEPSRYVYTQADSESYILGALAGFILDEEKKTWQSRVAEGITPLEIVLEAVLPVPAPLDHNLAADVKEEVRKINSATGPDIDAFRKRYTLAGVTRIFVDTDLAGSYSLSKGFFRVREIPYDLMVGLSSEAVWPSGHYRFNSVTAAAIDATTATTQHQFLVLYAGKLPASNKGRLKIMNAEMSLDIPYPADVGKTHTIHLH